VVQVALDYSELSPRELACKLSDERGEINTTILSLMKLTDVLDIELFKLFLFDSE
jgi:hypothetical protein